MKDVDARASILIVDDKPEKLLSLEAVLEDLDQRIVCASSGREALRHLLIEEFAVVLMDVNMPDMDGFEAAALIRQRPSMQHIPIIFITAFCDDMHMVRGYSLGAVDYIQAPVIPEVLRSKVSVFVDLHQKTAQVRRQSETLRRRATQLQKLAAASLAINSAGEIDQMLQIVTDSARDIIGSQQCLALLTIDPPSPSRQTRSAASFSDQHAKWRDREVDLEAAASTVIAQTPSSTRLSDLELRDHPDWEIIRGLDIPAIQSGLLAAPLTDRGGKNIGLIILLDCEARPFTSDDEALAMQLAQIISIAVQNAIFAREREANRVKDEFLATLSHELRTPLNAIVGWTQLLRMEKLPEEASRGLDVIDRNVKAQTKLIEDLLDVSRINSGKMRLNLREIELAPIVQAAVDAIRPAAEAKHIDLSMDLNAEIRLNADPDRLQQVIWNLLSNAVKFTGKDGRVQAAMERVNGQVLIRVTDTGQGIDAEFLRFVFDRFRQADSTTTRSQGGLGIGLAIVRHIVELHGGTVTAYSAGRGAGSEFSVMLPTSIPLRGAAPPPVSSVAAAPPPSRETLVKLGGTRVLLVDDELDAREMVCEILRRAGANVQSAGSAREAMECLGNVIPDVLVSDLAMPDEDGYSLIRGVRQRAPDCGGQLPAIALTAYAREEDRQRALSAGFQIFLTKPVDPRQLISSIAQMVRPINGADEELESHFPETDKAGSSFSRNVDLKYSKGNG